MEHLDPVKRRKNGFKQRHLIWSLLWTFRYEAIGTSECLLSGLLTRLGTMCLIFAFAELGGPVGINQLLA